MPPARVRITMSGLDRVSQSMTWHDTEPCQAWTGTPFAGPSRARAGLAPHGPLDMYTRLSLETGHGVPRNPMLTD